MPLYGTGSAPKIEMQIDGAWTDISTRVRGEQKVTVRRGRADEQGRTSAQTASLRLENIDTYFSNRNPNSANFGKIPINTGLRVSAGGETENFARFSAHTGSITKDVIGLGNNAAFDIAGDIEVRAEVWPVTWRSGRSMPIAARWRYTPNAFTWCFYITRSGFLAFTWCPDGLAGTRRTLTTTVAVPASSGRLAVRAAVDVNNGSGGVSITFYTAPSITGTWTQLGAVATSAGTTSLYTAGLGELTLGGGQDSNAIFTDGVPFGGRYYKFQLLNGLAGSAVADLDLTNKAVGASGFTDTIGNTVTLYNIPHITHDRFRFWGEVPSMPSEWTKKGEDIWADIQASGPLRRLAAGAVPLRSAMTRNFLRYNPQGLWMLDDGNASTRAASLVSGAEAATVTAVNFGTTSEMPAGTTGVAQFTTAASRLRGSTGPGSAGSAGASAAFYVYIPAGIPATEKTLATFFGTGSARRVTVGIGVASGWAFRFYDATGTQIGSHFVSISASLNNPSLGWIGVNLTLEGTVTDLVFYARFSRASTGAGSGTNANIATAPNNVAGRFSAFDFSGADDTTFNTLQLSSIFFAPLGPTQFDLSNSVFSNSARAWVGERASDRVARLALEEGIAYEVRDVVGQSEPMGAQGLNTVVDHFYDCADSDRGILGETRDALRVLFIARTDLELAAIAPGATLTYRVNSELSEVPQPGAEELNLTNDVTVSRSGGSYARVVNQSDGGKSIDRAQRYPTSPGVNIATDDRLTSVAGWICLLGSWDEVRYPSIAIGMHRPEVNNNATLQTTIYRLDLGECLTLAALPTFADSVDDVAEQVQGVTEVLTKFLWDITFNTTPAGPYRVGRLGSDQANAAPRLDATTHFIGTPMNTTSTSVQLNIPTASAPWITTAANPAEFPVDVLITGERMTLTAVTGAVADAFGRTSVSTLGTPDIGAAYVTNGGTATDYNVNGGLGRITSSTTNAHRYATITGFTAFDVDVTLTTAVSAVATGAELLNHLVARYQSATNLYRLEAAFTTAGAVDLRLRKSVSGTPTTLASASAVVTYSAGTLVSYRLRIQGSQLFAKLWLAAGAEPASWTIAATDTAFTVGSVGFGCQATTGNTNVSPEHRFDNLTVASPQLGTVTRSVNGVIKSHASGELIRLARPFYLGS